MSEGYTYDSEGQRVTRQRLIPQPNGVTTTYVGGLWEEDFQSGVSKETRAHIGMQGLGLAQRTRVASPASDATVYLHGDHLGSVSAATSATGAVLSRQAFTPWGELRAGGGDVTQTTKDFTGQLRDGTGLLFYNARYYDPKVGQFTSADTVAPAKGQPQSRNRYSYALNNLLRYTDPTGHVPVMQGNTVTSHGSLNSALNRNKILRADDPGGGSGYAPGCQTIRNSDCHDLERQFNQFGIALEDLYTWTAERLEMLLAGVRLFASALGGIENFIAAMGAVTLRYGGERGGARGLNIGGTIEIYAAAFWDTLAFGPAERNAASAIIHELAHQWDAKAGPPGQRLSSQMRAYLNFVGDDGIYPSDYVANNGSPDEDFAESVTSTILGPYPHRGYTPPIGDEPAYPGYSGSLRDGWVRFELCVYGGPC